MRKQSLKAKEWKPTSRLVDISPSNRTNAVAAYIKALGEEPPLPATIITDESGHILSAQPGVPSISALRKMLGLNP